MRRFALAILFLFCSAFAIHAHAAGPMRLVSLKPSITDVVLALGAGDRLVGVTKYCSGAPNAAVAGDYVQPYVERIVALSPDLVLGSEENSSRASVEKLRSMGLGVLIFPFSTVEETLSSVRGIGRALGLAERGEAEAERIEAKLRELKRLYAGEAPKRVVVIWGTRPLIAAGTGTYMDELLPFVGAASALPSSKIAYPRIGLEELIASDPDAIVDLSMGSESAASALGPGGGKPWSGVKELRAVRDGMVIALDASLFRAGPRLPEGLAKLGELLHRTSERQTNAPTDQRTN